MAAMFILLAAPAQSQQEPVEQSQPLTVGIYYSPPFVIEEDGQPTGMAIELWEAVADELGLQFEYRDFDTLRALVDAVAAEEIDAAVTNLTITEGRAQRIDFTQPWFDSGLRIMVHDERGAGLWGVISGLRDSGYLRAYAWLALIIVAATVGFTLFDRHFDKDFPRRWRDGFAESFYAVMSVVTSGRAPSRKNLFGWIGRIWQGIWLVCGIAVLAYVTSTVTSVMTTLALTSHINSIADLPGKTVGVAEGSTAEEFTHASIISSVSFASIAESSQALLDGRVDAVIGDKPVLEYFVHTHSDLPLSTVGALFKPEKYGFGLPHQSPLRKPLTVAVVGAHESGLVQQLRRKYFGDSP
ncbi:transporter substrate-binding domain-containing protein [Nitratireductor sp. GCM10026969]|uniref:transporter substrate-binding domain-containing protein n=1 Tax=Nitratireductor sp. GCM10026969 TaxID=3252645 RepID=UPI00361ED942